MGNSYVDVMAVPDLIEHSGVRETAVVRETAGTSVPARSALPGR